MSELPSRHAPIVDDQTMLRLLEQYDRPTPRYTSYPTAMEFHDRVGPADAQRHLDMAAQSSAPWSVYVHLPFCRERCWFCGCHVVIAKDPDRVRPYLDWVRREMDLVGARLGKRRGLAQLHLGGGTPTYFAPDELASFVASLLGAFEVVPGCELAFETDPRVTREEHLEALAALGFNRVSFGVQDLSPPVQRAIGRPHDPERLAELVAAARRLGYRGINADLIYGLPHQTPESIRATVEQVVAMGVDRAAVYSFAYLPQGRGHQKQIAPSELPAGRHKLALFTAARAAFLQAGYEPIGMDHFAAPTDELALARKSGTLRRNFQGYTVHSAPDVLGLGVSAIGDVAGAYLQNEKKLSRYEDALDAGALACHRGVIRTLDDRVRGRIIAEWMCNFRVDIPAIEAEFAVDFRSAFAGEWRRLELLEREGLVELGPSELRATPAGELLIRTVAAVFDAYRSEASAQPAFSRAV
jgi:oxygen-independent coproporphyrinogen-3 oxidase